MIKFMVDSGSDYDVNEAKEKIGAVVIEAIYDVIQCVVKPLALAMGI